MKYKNSELNNLHDELSKTGVISSDFKYIIEDYAQRAATLAYQRGVVDTEDKFNSIAIWNGKAEIALKEISQHLQELYNVLNSAYATCSVADHLCFGDVKSQRTIKIEAELKAFESYSELITELLE